MPKLTAFIWPGSFHPDKGLAASGVRFNAVQEAYEVLTDETAKAQYDALWEKHAKEEAKAAREAAVRASAALEQEKQARDRAEKVRVQQAAALEKAAREQEEKDAAERAALEKQEKAALEKQARDAESAALKKAALEKEEADQAPVQARLRAEKAARDWKQNVETAARDQRERDALEREKDVAAKAAREQEEQARGRWLKKDKVWAAARGEWVYPLDQSLALSRPTSPTDISSGEEDLEYFAARDKAAREKAARAPASGCRSWSHEKFRVQEIPRYCPGDAPAEKTGRDPVPGLAQNWGFQELAARGQGKSA